MMIAIEDSLELPQLRGDRPKKWRLASTYLSVSY
jgi:hypothetical protein